MSWDRILGQDAARHTLLTAIERGRLGQAYLLVGPEGVGKRLFAKELAKAFLCEQPPAKTGGGPGEPAGGSPMKPTACDRCQACAQVEAGTHPDLLFLRTPEGKHELPIEEMREVCGHLSRKPTR